MLDKIKSIDFKEIFDNIEDSCKIDYNAMYSSDINLLKIISNGNNNSYFVSIFFEKGEFIFDVDLIKYTIKSPAILFIPFNSMFKVINYQKNASLTFLLSSIALRENLLDNFSSEISVNTKIKIQPLSILNKEGEFFLLHHVNDIKRIFSYTHNPYRLEALKHLLTSAFYQYFYQLYSFDKVNDFGICEEFFKLLDEHYLDWKHSESYAKNLGVSKGHLDFVLRKKIGKSSKRMIDERIITEAKTLLKETNYPIEQIARELGFSSIDVFSRFFKRVTGVSPSKLRK